MSLDAQSTHGEHSEAIRLSQLIASEPDPIQREVLREMFHCLSVTKDPTPVVTPENNHKTVHEGEQKTNSQRRALVIEARKQRRRTTESTKTPYEAAQKPQGAKKEKENTVLPPTVKLPSPLSYIVARHTNKKLSKVQTGILDRFDAVLRALPEGSRQDDVINLLIAFRKDLIKTLRDLPSVRNIRDAARIMKAVQATLYVNGFFSLDRAQSFANTYNMAFYDTEAEQEEV